MTVVKDETHAYYMIRKLAEKWRKKIGSTVYIRDEIVHISYILWMAQTKKHGKFASTYYSFVYGKAKYFEDKHHIVPLSMEQRSLKTRDRDHESREHTEIEESDLSPVIDDCSDAVDVALAIASLKPEFKDIAKLALFDKLSETEIAEIKGLSRQRIHQKVAAIAKLLEERRKKDDNCA